jgi:hypothetical protein
MSGSRLKRPKPARQSAPTEAEEPLPENVAAAHPIAELSGLFKDDPLWEEFVQAMQRARAEENAKEDVPGRDERD